MKILANSVIDNKAWLINQYVKKKKSTIKIAREQNVTDETIRQHLIKYNISRRNAYETTANHIELSSELLGVLEGNLLGDGCLFAINKSATYLHTSKYKKYLEWLVDILSNFDIKISGKINYYKKEWAATYNFRTKYYRELKTLYNKWYPNGKKIVPNDLELTPTILLHWFLGDGSFQHNGTRYMRVGFATEGFSRQDCNFLAKCLMRHNIHPTLPKNGNLFVNLPELHSFFSFLPQCPQEIQDIYDYKWPDSKELKYIEESYKHKIFLNNHRTKEWLYNQYYTIKLSQPKIAKKLGVSPPTIVRWMKQFDISPKIMKAI